MTKAQTTRTRKQTEKGKYNARKRKEKTSEFEESSEEETRQRRHKKRSKMTEETDSEDVGSNASNIEDVIEVTSNNGSESGIQVGIWHLMQNVANENLIVKNDCSRVDDHHLVIPAKISCKKDMARDVRLLFSDRIMVKFTRDGETKTLEGRWCTVCK